jgi:hypothetical protein
MISRAIAWLVALSTTNHSFYDFHIWQPFEANETSSTIWVWEAQGFKTKVDWKTKSVLENAFVRIDER